VPVEQPPSDPTHAPARASRPGRARTSRARASGRGTRAGTAPPGRALRSEARKLLVARRGMRSGAGRPRKERARKGSSGRGTARRDSSRTATASGRMGRAACLGRVPELTTKVGSRMLASMGHRAAEGSSRFAGGNTKQPLIAASVAMSWRSPPTSVDEAEPGARPPSRGDGAVAAWTGPDNGQRSHVFGLDPGKRTDHGHDQLVEQQAQGSIGQGRRSRGGRATDSFMEQGPEDAGRRESDRSTGNSCEGSGTGVRNVERETVAVTRYGCGRGKSFEG